MSTSFATILRDLAARRPDAPALTCGDVTWTFRDLDARSSQTAQALIADGVRPGDRVGVIARNCPEFYELIFACNKVGAILVGLNWRLSSFEIAAIVADAAPAIIVTGTAGEADLLDDTVRGSKTLRRVVMLGEPYEAWRAAASTIDPAHPGKPDDVAMLLYTSGTTGLPKAAMLTNLGMAHTQRLGHAWGMTEQSVNLVAMPLFHIGGSGYGSSTMLVGGHTVLMREVNLPLIMQTMEKHRVTHAFFVPTVLQALLAVPGIDQADLGSMELLMYGASPIGESLLRNALQVLSCDFIQAYGMTETSGTVVTLKPEEHRLDGRAGNRLRSCGKALPFAEIRITNPVTGNEVPRGDVARSGSAPRWS
jgi:long-chain acyl-CoA synthetase